MRYRPRLDSRLPRRSEKCFAKLLTLTLRKRTVQMRGATYLFEHALPNLFFHITTAYAILRHNGVGIGKADYLGPR